jgi:hypothetical protein
MIYHEINFNANNENIAFEFANFLTYSLGFTEVYSDECLTILCIEESKYDELLRDKKIFAVYNDAKFEYITNTSSVLTIYSKDE